MQVFAERLCSSWAWRRCALCRRRFDRGGLAAPAPQRFPGQPPAGRAGGRCRVCPAGQGGTAADADRAGPPAVRAHRRDAARQRCAHGLSASRAPQEPHPCQRAGGAAPDRRPAGGRHRRRHARGAGFRRQRQCPHAAQCRRLDQPAAFRYRAGPAAGRASAAGHRNAGRDACRGGVRAGRSARRSAGPDHAARWARAGSSACPPAVRCSTATSGPSAKPAISPRRSSR